MPPRWTISNRGRPRRLDGRRRPSTVMASDGRLLVAVVHAACPEPRSLTGSDRVSRAPRLFYDPTFNLVSPRRAHDPQQVPFGVDPDRRHLRGVSASVFSRHGEHSRCQQRPSRGARRRFADNGASTWSLITVFHQRSQPRAGARNVINKALSGEKDCLRPPVAMKTNAPR